MLKPFISVSIVSHNEVILLIVEIEQHQRSALCSFETPDESIHSFLLNLLLFFLGRSSLVSLFYFSFRLHFCGSLLADVANFSFFFSETHLHLGFLEQILPSRQRPSSSVFLFTKSIPGHSRRWGTNYWQQHTKLFVSLNSTKRSAEAWFFILWTNGPIGLKASLTDRAAVDQKASLTFQSDAAQIRQRRPFWDGCRLSDVLGGQ